MNGKNVNIRLYRDGKTIEIPIPKDHYLEFVKNIKTILETYHDFKGSLKLVKELVKDGYTITFTNIKK